MITTKLVSVITPVRNAGKTLARTVSSVIGQDPSLADYHIVDGGSADDTLEVAHRHAPDSDVLSEPDSGIYDAINKGIARSRGRFLYVLGAGDVLRPGALTALAARLENMPPHSIVYGNVYWVSRRRVYDGRFSKSDLTTHCICHQAMFIDRSVFDLMGTYDLRYPISADWHFNIRCFSDARVRVHYVDDVIAEYEGGGVSDTGYDAAFQSDLPAIIRRAFGRRYLLILWQYRLRRRVLGLALGVRARIGRILRGKR